MGSEHHPVHHNGLYRNLPTFDPSIKGLTAIVTGANGISGFHTMRVLLESPERWSKVYALSRRPPPEKMMALLSESQRARVQHVAVDFLDEPGKIASAMTAANLQADYIFFYSYVQPRPPPGAAAWSNAEELVKVNSALLDNFLAALTLSKITARRFLLQTGAKNYGTHVGRARTPALESDPQPAHLEPNFYYAQEKSLFAYCAAQKTSWNVIRPAWIVGAVNNAQMNALHPFAIYAAVQAHKNEPLQFPADWDAWQFEAHHSTAMLTGYLSEWAVLEDKCKNQAFNSQDTSPLSWDRFYEELARWFGVAKGVQPPDEDLSKYSVIVGKSGKDTPMGYGPPKISRRLFSLVDWARNPTNKTIWETEIMQPSQGQVSDNPFADPEASFTFGDAALASFGSLCMNKARRLGWTGFVDTIESVFQMYQEMAALGMLPKMKVDKPRPLV
ncbi:hypothetical protein HRR83_007488 [Exophiala dermatitidis]|uniref:PRISE-like Rossmann-fold domain-containing protein n=2 Tax=Exophiala dermatitidis TaxID=5970 RepID=H6C2I4_EXODN|nr:uncharacterized protein HMPREF1120_06765 [Exophiala dermatitidis NIH/UT8656]KAJ4508544.1 hypothetical protein HRR75_006365 [Exophiala dermatitidis]EHY58762.1 hypothetical protein HMPREF1120_06765 [Exophiala dermatitidis NIH/UT8656]KAJ4510462.1 hypothetical protein HRR74_006934 [Exophiala dermatitidis]KAJ4510604.1 hypothetical protein HRR73_006676 [Exophiala dermatitidis]KAJ4535072.1 hypothetical protein HRR76_006972 [Exophiala dermatitidis]